MKQKSSLLFQLFELLIIVILLFLANRRAWYCFLVLDDREYYCEYGNISSDYFWWGIVVAGVILLVLQRNLLREYVARWQANWPLLIFILYSLLSLLWTVQIDRSIHTVYILIAASVSAAGLATIYSRERLFRLLLWFSGLTALLSLTAVILLPQTAITQIDYLAGTWRGLFWHKNYFGSVMAFGNGLFLYSVLQNSTNLRARVLSSGFYLLTLFLVIMSQSATGIIIVFLLHGICLAYFAWRKWGNLARRRHYVWFATLFSLITGAVLLNLASIFSLIGKNITLTGRVPVWRYLLQDIVSQRPWLGYGWETVWYERSFQVAAANAANWGIVVINSHSGYMDILVYLGAVGFAIFLLAVLQASMRAFGHAFSSTGSQNLAPLLILAYVLITNITISYFLEFESFHWVLLVFVLFMTLSSSNVKSTQVTPYI